MNFALMFALALGIDYALFVVHRFRGAYFGSGLRPRDAVAITMDTAGKAVLFSGADRPRLALGRDARAEPRLPLDGARDHAQRRLRARRDADAAAGRAREARARRSTRCRCAGCTRASTARRASPAGASGSGATRTSSAQRRRSLLVLLALPVLGLKTGMPSIKVVPKSDGSRVGYAQVQQAFGAGRARRAPDRRTARARPRAVAAIARRDSGHRPGRSRRSSAATGSRSSRRSRPPTPPSASVGRTIDRLRDALPAGALVGGAAAENHDLEQALRARRRRS